MAVILKIKPWIVYRLKRALIGTRALFKTIASSIPRVVIRKKWALLAVAVLYLIICIAIPEDWAPLDLMKTVLDHRDADFEGPNGTPWKRLLNHCPANITCVHLATHRFGSTSNWESVLGRGSHPSCSSDCQLVSDPSQAHALIFHLFDIPSRRRLRRMHATRKHGQAWIMYNLEPPIHASTSKCYYTCDYLYPLQVLLANIKEMFLPSYLLRVYPDTTDEAGFFNWTMTYRRDSTFYVPYAEFGHIPHGLTRALPPPAVLVSKKKYLIFAAVSNCHPHNRREDVLRELESVMELHVYGRCGSRRMAPGESLISVSERYYFYLSFENSFCKDYITEKFFVTGLNGHAVPVVFGGTAQEEYDAVAPPNSYIYASNFSTAAALAKFLGALASRPEEYARYKAWRATHTMVNRQAIMETNTFCSICRKLKTKAKSEQRRGLDLNRFYNTAVDCKAQDYWPFI